MEVECTHCGTTMSRSPGAGNNVYYSCPRCARTFASVYDEAIRRRAGIRPAPPPAPEPRCSPDDRRFEEIKAKLDAWLRRLDEADPYYVLGVEPGAPLPRVRARYYELALLHHPDRGGDPREMRRIARAYEAIRDRLGPEDPATAPRALARPAAAAVAAVASRGGRPGRRIVDGPPVKKRIRHVDEEGAGL